MAGPDTIIILTSFRQITATMANLMLGFNAFSGICKSHTEEIIICISFTVMNTIPEAIL